MKLAFTRPLKHVRSTVASKLVEAGCQTIEDLRLPEFNSMLLPAMRVGLDFLDHLDKPVTREEAEIVLVSPSGPTFISPNILLFQGFYSR